MFLSFVPIYNPTFEGQWLVDNFKNLITGKEKGIYHKQGFQSTTLASAFSSY